MRCVSSMHSYIRRLEEFAERCGAPVVRNSLVAGVLGQIEERRIVLRAGLTLEQQLLTLVHELTHLIIHCNASPRVNRTVCEYEAEAVERWVGAALKVGPSDEETLDAATMTEDLLACSVVRVRWASHVILKVARDSAFGLPSRLQSQAAVEIDAPAREEVVLNDELHGVRNFIRLAQAL
jgi:IrrE N-terminal-like domain